MCSENMSAFEVTVEWNNPGTVLLATGSSLNPEILTLSPEQTKYVLERDNYTELRIFPAEGYVLKSVSNSDDPDKKNDITQSAAYRQQSFYGIGDSWDGRTINIETAEINYDGELSINVINGADYLDAYLDFSFSEGSGTMRYSYGYRQTLSLTDSENKIPFAPDYMKNLTIDLNKNAFTKSIYKVTRNGEEQTPIGSGYYMTDMSADDIIEVQVFEGEVPVVEEVSFTLDYPEEIEGCIRNLFDRTTSQFLCMDADYNFIMPADQTFKVVKGSEIQVNFNEGYTLTGFMLGSENVTDSYSEANNYIRVTIDEDVTLSIAGEMTQYADMEFTAYIYNADGVRLTLEDYQGIPNPVKDVTGEPGEVIAEDINIPSYTISDKNAGSGEDGNTSTGNTKTIPAVTMTPDNTLKFTVKVSERRPLIYISPVVGYYIQSVWDSEMEAPIGYIDGNDPVQRTFYVVAQKLDRDQQFIVEMTGNDEVSFRPSDFFQRNWSNPSISFAIGEGVRTYDYNAIYDNPFELYPTVQSAGFDVTLNGRQAGITKTELGTYIIDFTQAYVTDKYPIPTLKVKSGSNGIDEIETNVMPKGPIYNLQGLRLTTGWDALPAGIYIYGGKKIIKK